MGRIAVDRAAAHDVVSQNGCGVLFAAECLSRDHAGGNEKAGHRWRTGFWHIAKVPASPYCPSSSTGAIARSGSTRRSRRARTSIRTSRSCSASAPARAGETAEDRISFLTRSDVFDLPVIDSSPLPMVSRPEGVVDHAPTRDRSDGRVGSLRDTRRCERARRDAERLGRISTVYVWKVENVRASQES